MGTETWFPALRWLIARPDGAHDFAVERAETRPKNTKDTQSMQNEDSMFLSGWLILGSLGQFRMASEEFGQTIRASRETPRSQPAPRVVQMVGSVVTGRSAHRNFFGDILLLAPAGDWSQAIPGADRPCRNIGLPAEVPRARQADDVRIQVHVGAHGKLQGVGRRKRGRRRDIRLRSSRCGCGGNESLAVAKVPNRRKVSGRRSRNWFS